MSNLNKNRSGGFIKTALVVIITVIAVSFFVDVKSIVDSKIDSKRLSNNFQYFKTLSISVWNEYISPTTNKVWNKIFKKDKDNKEKS